MGASPSWLLTASEFTLQFAIRRTSTRVVVSPGVRAMDCSRRPQTRKGSWILHWKPVPQPGSGINSACDCRCPVSPETD